MTPAFTSSSLNFPISVSSSLLGKTPASESLLPGTMTMTLIPTPFRLDGSLAPALPGRVPTLLIPRTKLHKIDTLHLRTLSECEERLSADWRGSFDESDS